MTWSGGSVNHYVSRLVGVVLKMGLETEHLHNIRHIYKVGVFFVAWMFLSAKPDPLGLHY